MHTLAVRLLSHTRQKELLQAGDRVGVAVSGGIDSVALLRLLLELRSELGIVLSVVHFNHKLRGAESDSDEQFVADLAREHSLEFVCDCDDVAEHASLDGLSVEAAARGLRYGFFRHLLSLEGTSRAKAQDQDRAADRSAGSAAPPTKAAPPKSAASHPNAVQVNDGPQGLEPVSLTSSSGKTEAVPTRARRALSRLDKIATGHTLDDQAETVLMRIIRGTGLAGLGGIHPRLLVENDDAGVSGEIVRPLLSTRRCELEQFLKDIGQVWRDDSTNSDHAFTRNRLRGLVVPLLEREFNPAVATNLAELAEIARGEEEYWENEVAGWMGTAVHWSEPEWARAASKRDELVQIGGLGDGFSTKGPTSRARNTREMRHPVPADDDLQSRIDCASWLVADASISRPWLLSEPIAVQRRVVKSIGEHAGIPLEFKHVDEILRWAAEEGPAGRGLSLPLGWRIVRHPEELLFVTPDLRETNTPQDYEYELPVPRTVVLHEAGIVLEVHRVPADQVAEYNPDQLLDADSLPGPLRVRNWRAGDRFWPAHTKSPKKIKELLQERHVPQSERASWPVVLCGDQIVWVREFPVHAKYRTKAGGDVILITETSRSAEPET